MRKTTDTCRKCGKEDYVENLVLVDSEACPVYCPSCYDKVNETVRSIVDVKWKLGPKD